MRRRTPVAPVAHVAVAVVVAPLLVALAAAPDARAATYYVATSGSDTNAGTTADRPFKTIRKGVGAAQAGDTVYIRGGTYTEAVSLPRSGTASAWITVSAYPGELPILEGNGGGGTGLGSSTAQYVRVVGIAARDWASSGFSNGWVDAGTSNGNLQFVNCIADGNGINGIAFYRSTGVLIEQCIVAHNGNTLPSWSSGVNVFAVGGTYQDNIVRRTVSFENIDISDHHTDGSGYILDQGSTGALFENNIGFRNGGSCIRITNSSGGHFVNNSCYHDGLDQNDVGPASPGEIFFSDATSRNGVVMVNNLGAASGWNNTQAAFNFNLGTNNYAVDRAGATPFFANPDGVDFHLTAGSSAVIDKGTSSNAPANDIGFDPKCITKQGGQAVSFWQYAPDYDYIRSVGGVAGCFNPAARPAGSAPDIGAYEWNGTVGGTGAGGASGTGAGGAGAGGAGGMVGSGAGGMIGTGAGGMVGSGAGGTIGTGGMVGSGSGGVMGSGTGGRGGTAGATGAGGASAGSNGADASATVTADAGSSAAPDAASSGGGAGGAGASSGAGTGGRGGDTGGGMATTGGAPGAGGATPATGSGAGGGAPGLGGPTPGTPGNVVGGCACSTGGGTAPGPAVLGLVLLTVHLLRRRRRAAAHAVTRAIRRASRRA